MKNDTVKTGIVGEILNYTKTKLPFFSPKIPEILSEPLQKVIYSLTYLKIGRANYLESQARGKRIWSDKTSPWCIDADQLRKEAFALMEIMKIDIGGKFIDDLLSSKHEIPTGTYGLPTFGLHHY